MLSVRVAVIAAMVALVSGKAHVHHRVFRELALADQIGLLVTMRAANVSAANNPALLGQELARLVHFQALYQPHDLASPEKYHQARGEYVLDVITKHHAQSRDRLLLALPDGVEIEQSVPLSNSFVIKGGKEVVERLADLEDVEEVFTTSGFKVNLPRPNKNRIQSGLALLQRLHSGLDDDQEKNIQWNIRKIGADKVWASGVARSRGQGVTYAIADTGVEYKHANIRNNYKGLRADGSYDHNYAWYDGVRKPVAAGGRTQSRCGVASNEPCDDQGHGTHVTSTAVGADGFGVAPGARWIGCRNMDNGLGAPVTYLLCLNFFLAPHDLQGRNPRPELRPHVIGNSYGCPDSEGCSKRAMKAAVEALRAAGIFMSVSAGNEGPNCSTVDAPPALEPLVFSVGATDEQDKLARFSSRGPVIIDGQQWRKPDISAPGVGIMAAYPGDGMRRLSGTSMASPHVSGAVILLTANCPCLERDNERLQAILQSTAVHLLPPAGERLCGQDTAKSVPNNFFGYGRIDLINAVNVCRELCASFK